MVCQRAPGPGLGGLARLRAHSPVRIDHGSSANDRVTQIMHETAGMVAKHRCRGPSVVLLMLQNAREQVAGTIGEQLLGSALCKAMLKHCVEESAPPQCSNCSCETAISDGDVD